MFAIIISAMKHNIVAWMEWNQHKQLWFWVLKIKTIDFGQRSEHTLFGTFAAYSEMHK